MANLSGFDLNLLRVLDALLRDHSTVRAGERLGLSQPAVSASLGRLRAALGDPLLYRHGQGLVPTEFARSLAAPLRDVLIRIEALIQGPQAFDPASSDAGFRISGSDFFAEMLMPSLAGRMAALAPGMRVHLVDLVAVGHVDILERHDVDLALVPEVALPDWVESCPVFRSTFSVVARRAQPRIARARVAAGEEIPLDLFCDLGHVLFSPEGSARAMGDLALDRIGRKRRVVMSLPVFSGVCRAVAGSDLVALLPTALAVRIAPGLGLEIYLPPMPLAPVQMQMIWHRRHTDSPSHRWIRSQIVDLLGPLDTFA